MPTKPTDSELPDAGRALAPLIAPEAVYPLAAAGGAGLSPVAVYLARLAPGSRPAMRGALKTAARLLTGLDDPVWERLPWCELRRPHLAALRAALAERCAPASANKILSAVRGVLKEAVRLDLLTAEEFSRAADVGNVKGSRPLRGRALTPGELIALFAACAADPSPTGARDAALLAVLCGCGLRRAEAAALALGDFDAEAGTLQVRRGKGNRGRLVHLPDGAAAALGAWCAVRGAEAGPLFVRIRKGGRRTGAGLTPQAVLYRLNVRRLEAGVRPFSPHDLRRTFISSLLDAGADLAAAQRMAGHASTVTTARYDRRGAAAEKRAAGLLHVPYTGGGES